MTEALLAQLPALQVAIPLLAAPACVLAGRGDRAWLIALGVSWLALATAAALLALVLARGTISYALGGWAPPWGIEYRVDELNALLLVLVAASSSIVLVFARDSVRHEVPRARRSLFYTAWLLCLTGLLGIAITGDAFNVFVFLEIASLSTYALVAMARDPRALSAAFRYLVMGTVGATFILIGIGFLYVSTGTLNMADLAERLPAAGDSRTVRAALGFLTVGIGIKMALFPLHGWLPGAYSSAPSAVSAFVAASATKVGVYLWIRFLFTVFDVELAFDTLQVGRVTMALASVAVVAGSLAAVFQSDAKQVLAYSSVAQIGYMVLGVSFASVTGLTAALVHVFNHGLMKMALFMAIGCVAYRVGSSAVTSLEGLARRMPWTMAALLVAGLSLIGVPFTAGFVSKWYLLSAALEQGHWVVAALVVVASLVAIVYVWRLVEPAWLRAPVSGSAQDRAREVPAPMLAALWVAAGANLYFGVHTDVPVGVAARAAAVLLGGAP